MELVEASMNFEGPNVRPFLERLERKLHALSPADVDRLSREIAAVPVDEEREWQFDVTHEGQNVPFRIRVAMDDIDALDMYFFTVPALAAAVEKELRAFADERFAAYPQCSAWSSIGSSRVV
jgi:hypothetical protein